MAEINKINIKGVDYDIGGEYLELFLQLSSFTGDDFTKMALIFTVVPQAIGVGTDSTVSSATITGVDLTEDLTNEQKEKILNLDYKGIKLGVENGSHFITLLPLSASQLYNAGTVSRFSRYELMLWTATLDNVSCFQILCEQQDINDIETAVFTLNIFARE